MAVYCYKCPDCGAKMTGTDRDLNVGAVHCTRPILRDYRAEGASFNGVADMKKEREHGSARDMRDLFLPTAAEEATPEDPDGSKYIADWNERHVPAEGNKLPVRPEHVRKTF